MHPFEQLNEIKSNINHMIHSGDITLEEIILLFSINDILDCIPFEKVLEYVHINNPFDE